MQKQMKTMILTGISLIFLFCAIFFILPEKADAKSKLKSIKGVSYNVNASITDNLKSLIGKRVYIHLDSGTTYIGVVKEIGGQLIHLEKLDRKDFFDALIRLDKIIAIDTQYWKYQK